MIFKGEACNNEIENCLSKRGVVLPADEFPFEIQQDFIGRRS